MARLGNIYTAVARFALGLGLAFLAINAVLYMFPSLRPGLETPTPISVFGVDALMPAYPGWTRDDVSRLHDESRVVFQYEPIVQFHIKPLRGQYVNTDAAGFRQNAAPAVWPPRPDHLNVFVFGGSTTFGWLVPDRETIVSQLEDRGRKLSCARPVSFYNFGHPSYISTQEALLFQQLVLGGTAPNVAVFIDGLNDFVFHGQMSFTSALKGMMDDRDIHHTLGALTRTPLFRLLQKVNASRYRAPTLDARTEQELFDRVTAEWLRSRNLVGAIARHGGVRTVQVWQPVPTYKYNLANHFLERQGLFRRGAQLPYEELGRAYAGFEARRADLEKNGDFLWLGDMQEGRNENLYVDRIHYNGPMSGEIASRILAFLNTNRMLGCEPASK